MTPWNNWLHCTGSTYGTWLRGDAPGWRARHHREHVDGDYRAPPPDGIYDVVLEQSKRLMKREGGTLKWDARVLACQKTVEALRWRGVQVADLCVGAHHWHVLARFFPIDNDTWRIIEMQGMSQNRNARHLIGIAKKESARALSQAGIVEPGGVWAKGCGRKYIRNQWHFERVTGYIPDHAKQGAAVYSLLFGRH